MTSRPPLMAPAEPAGQPVLSFARARAVEFARLRRRKWLRAIWLPALWFVLVECATQQQLVTLATRNAVDVAVPVAATSSLLLVVLGFGWASLYLAANQVGRERASGHFAPLATPRDRATAFRAKAAAAFSVFGVLGFGVGLLSVLVTGLVAAFMGMPMTDLAEFVPAAARGGIFVGGMAVAGVSVACVVRVRRAGLAAIGAGIAVSAVGGFVFSQGTLARLDPVTQFCTWIGYPGMTLADFGSSALYWGVVFAVVTLAGWIWFGRRA